MIIGICDDDRYWLEKAEKIIRVYGKTNHLNFNVFVFENQKDLFNMENWSPDILFLDIVLDNENSESGISMAKKVNDVWKKCQVVFLTNYLYYAMDVYQTNHIFFVIKEQFENRINEVFDKAIHALQQSVKKLVFMVKEKTELILAPEEIYYFERNLRTTKIYTSLGTFETKESLDMLQNRLPEIDFVRCHNSFIVYLPFVMEIQKNSFVLRDGTSIMISRSYLKCTKEKFINWALMQR